MDDPRNVEGRVASESGVVESGAQQTIDADVFAQLATELQQTPEVEETVEAVVEFALQAESCAHAGLVHALGAGRAEIAAVTGPVVREIFELQMGILMERFDVDGDHAFKILRRTSQQTNSKLLAVALGVIDTRSVSG